MFRIYINSHFIYLCALKIPVTKLNLEVVTNDKEETRDDSFGNISTSVS